MDRSPLPFPVGFTVLFVEDSALIALDGEAILVSLGVSRVEIAGTIEAAREILARTAVDAALLDLRLGDQSSLVIADQLMAHKVPFGFMTGYSDNHEIPDRFTHIPVLAKPYTDEQVGTLLRRVLGPAQ